jgi:hypothetical protein
LGEDDDVVVVGGGFGGVFAGKSTAVAAGLLSRTEGGAAVSLIEHVCVDLEDSSRSRSDERGGCARLVFAECTDQKINREMNRRSLGWRRIRVSLVAARVASVYNNADVAQQQ